MQDNNSEEFDEQFVDQAWLEMRHLLDQEMPVQPKRRVAGWLWLLAGLFLILLLAGGAYQFYRVGENPKPSPLLSSPTARMESPSASSDMEEKPVQKKEQRSIAKSSDIQKRQPDPESGALPNDPVAPPHLGGNENNAYPLPALNRPTRINTAVKKEQATIDGLGSKEIGSKKNEAILPKEKLAAPTYLRWSVLPALPATKVAFLPVPAMLEKPAELHQPILRQPRILRVAAEGGAYLPGHSVSKGLSGGLAVEIHPRASRLYLRTGAFFRWYKQELKTEETALRLENSFFKNPQPDGSSVNRTSQLTTQATINQASYIQFPFLAGFQWTPRLAFESGIQAGFLTSSQATNRWGLISESSLPGDPEATNNTIYEFRRGAGYYILNNTSFDVIASLAYRPSQRTSLRLSYQHGLSDILGHQREKAYMRGVQLSLAWYFLGD